MHVPSLIMQHEAKGDISPRVHINYLCFILQREALRKFDSLANENGDNMNFHLKENIQGLGKMFLVIYSSRSTRCTSKFAGHDNRGSGVSQRTPPT